MPLLDSALLVAAKEKGFAAGGRHRSSLVRETSWANIRDRLAVGHFQVAHVLAPMPIACNLGLTPLAAPTIAPMALGLGGNAVTVSNALWARNGCDRGAKPDLDPARPGARCRRSRPTRARRRSRRLRFAVVHPHSGPQLRTALLAGGVRHRSGPRRRNRHRAAAADGGRAGERNDRRLVRRRAVEHGACAAGPRTHRHGESRDLAVQPGKGPGRRRAWAEENPEALAALLRALCRAAQWCGDPGNRGSLRRFCPARLSRRGRPNGCCRRCRGHRCGSAATAVARRRLLHSVRQGRDLPVEEPRAVVLFADGALGAGAHTPGTQRSRARPIGPISTGRR